MEEIRITYRILMRKPLGRRSLAKPMRWEMNRNTIAGLVPAV
jgi:hypothetical protein